MMLIELSDGNREEALRAAADTIMKGGIAAFPTETYYALGARYDNVRALGKLYEMKGRPNDKAIPLIIGDVKTLGLVTPAVNATALKLMAKFWPGPLTILLDARKDLPELITAGTGKVAVRVPGASFSLDLARAVDLPVTSTSANISGMPAADNARDVIDYFGNAVDIVIDGGKTPGGKPSTIVETGNGGTIVLRAGRIPEEEILRTLGA